MGEGGGGVYVGEWINGCGLMLVDWNVSLQRFPRANRP